MRQRKSGLSNAAGHTVFVVLTAKVITSMTIHATKPYRCRDRGKRFSVKTNSVMPASNIGYQKWAIAMYLITTTLKGVPRMKLHRDLRITQKSAWHILHRIREAWETENEAFDSGVEAGETYIGSKPRKDKKQGGKPNKRGRGTKKTPVIGAVERGGKVNARVAIDLTGRGILKFIMGTVSPENSRLIADEYQAYRAVPSRIPHDVINHSEHSVDGDIHTNTIEGFWALLKRAWYDGQHQHYQKGLTPLYIAEAAYKYNHRNVLNTFDVFVRRCFA